MNSVRRIAMKAKRFIYASEFKGEPKHSNFKLVEEELPALKDGEFLTESVYLSVDPYMRGKMTPAMIGTTMIGGQVGK